MRVGIIGSRTILKYNIHLLMREIPSQCTEIVSGGAKGVDQLAVEAAGLLKVPVTEFLPDYETYGKSAPLRRNEEIVRYCDLLIAVWDYRSKGTRDGLIKAVKCDKPIKVVIV